MVGLTHLGFSADPNLVLNILTIAGLIGVAWAAFNSGGLGVLRQANEDLRRHKKEADAKIRELTQLVGLLETRTSLEPMVASVIEQFQSHEERAQARHEVMLDSQTKSTNAMLGVLDLVARRLGPDPNGKEH